MTNILDPILGTNPDHIQITNSEIQSFKDCKRKWYLNYYLGLGPKTENKIGPLPLGVRVHNSLEKYYTDDMNPVWTYKRLAKEDKEIFLETEEFLDDEKIKKFDSESELGRIMVEGYVEWVEEENRDADFEFVSAEKSVSVPLEINDQSVTLMGKVDLQLRKKMDDAVLITDFKTTAASAWNNYNLYSHMSEQLMLYVTLARAAGDKVDGGMYRLLKKVKRTGTAKPPFYDDKIVRFNDTQLESFWTRTMSTIYEMVDARQRLDAGESHLSVVYPRPSNECSWKCPFFQMCTMMDDGSDYTGFLNDQFIKRDPNARYGEESNSSK